MEALVDNMASGAQTQRIAKGLLKAIREVKDTGKPVPLKRPEIEGVGGSWNFSGQQTLWAQIGIKLGVHRYQIDEFFAAGNQYDRPQKIADCPYADEVALYGWTPIGNENDFVPALALAPPDYNWN